MTRPVRMNTRGQGLAHFVSGRGRMTPKRPTSAWLAYLLAFVAVALTSLGARLFSTSPDVGVLVLLYLGVVTLTAWYGGLGPALLATVLSYLAANVFFIPTRSAFSLNYNSVTFI